MTPIEIVVGFFAALGILCWLKDAFGFSPRGGGGGGGIGMGGGR